MFALFKKNDNIPSKDIARGRLKMVLVADRIGSSQMIERMKQDILDVLRNYMDIDETDFDIQISQQELANGDEQIPRLKADIPIKNVRRPV